MTDAKDTRKEIADLVKLMNWLLQSPQNLTNFDSVVLKLTEITELLKKEALK